MFYSTVLKSTQQSTATCTNGLPVWTKHVLDTINWANNMHHGQSVLSVTDTSIYTPVNRIWVHRNCLMTTLKPAGYFYIHVRDSLVLLCLVPYHTDMANYR